MIKKTKKSCDDRSSTQKYENKPILECRYVVQCRPITDILHLERTAKMWMEQAF